MAHLICLSESPICVRGRVRERPWSRSIRESDLWGRVRGHEWGSMAWLAQTDHMTNCQRPCARESDHGLLHGLSHSLSHLANQMTGNRVRESEFVRGRVRGRVRGHALSKPIRWLGTGSESPSTASHTASHTQNTNFLTFDSNSTSERNQKKVWRLHRDLSFRLPESNVYQNWSHDQRNVYRCQFDWKFWLLTEFAWNVAIL